MCSRRRVSNSNTPLDYRSRWCLLTLTRKLSRNTGLTLGPALQKVERWDESFQGLLLCLSGHWGWPYHRPCLCLWGSVLQHLNRPGLVTVTVSVDCPVIPRQGGVLNLSQVHPGRPVRNNSRKWGQKQDWRRRFLPHWSETVKETGLKIITSTE